MDLTNLVKSEVLSCVNGGSVATSTSNIATSDDRDPLASSSTVSCDHPKPKENNAAIRNADTICHVGDTTSDTTDFSSTEEDPEPIQSNNLNGESLSRNTSAPSFHRKQITSRVFVRSGHDDPRQYSPRRHQNHSTALQTNASTGMHSSANTRHRASYGVTIGDGVTSRLKAVPRKDHHENNRSPDRSCSGIFVTRLLPRCKPGEVARHIHDVSGKWTKLEKLQTEYNTYSSFYVRCDSHLRSLLTKSVSWPSGVMIKPF